MLCCTVQWSRLPSRHQVLNAKHPTVPADMSHRAREGNWQLAKSTLPGVDKDVVNLLLRRRTLGAVKASGGSNRRVSEDRDETAAEERDKEHQGGDQEADRDIDLQ